MIARILFHQPLRLLLPALSVKDPERPHYSEYGMRLKLANARRRERKYRPPANEPGYKYLLGREWAEVLARARLTDAQRAVLELRRRGWTFVEIGRSRGHTKQSAQRIHSQALRHIDEARESYPYTGLAEAYRADTKRR